MILVFGPLGIEKKAFPALGGLSNIGVCDLSGFLIAQVGGEMIVLQWCFTQPEILLGKDQAPAIMLAVARWLFLIAK